MPYRQTAGQTHLDLLLSDVVRQVGHDNLVSDGQTRHTAHRKASGGGGSGLLLLLTGSARLTSSTVTTTSTTTTTSTSVASARSVGFLGRDDFVERGIESHGRLLFRTRSAVCVTKHG